MALPVPDVVHGLYTSARRIAVRIRALNMKNVCQIEVIKPVKKQRYLVTFTFTGKKSMGITKELQKEWLAFMVFILSTLSI
ncbi:hypothetical protein FNI11_12735 [Salmonella enterica subsp. salamae]|nr:hypothetical protein [Salmonella enterica subsp. salamae]ECJ2281437.1 hypothetical protein [Salmonella enterica subsp. salamae]